VVKRLIGLALISVTLGALPSSASASQAIESFSVGSTSTQAGGHPDLETSISIANPGLPETAQTVTVNLPSGIFGNPHAVAVCSASDFALTQCPTASQVGVITVRANHEGQERFLLGTAPVYDVHTQSEDETARLAFVAPMVDIPISIPVTVRTAADYGLRFSVTGISQSIPLFSAHLTVWGFPALSSHDEERFRTGSPGSPAGCPEEETALCASYFGATPNAAGIATRPLIDNPSACTGEPLGAVAEVRTYQDPTHVSTAEASYPATTGCEKETSTPIAEVFTTSESTDSASGLDILLNAPQPEGFSVTPSSIHAVRLTLPKGLNINPDAADGQQTCSDAQAKVGSETRAECPDSAKIGNFEIESGALDGTMPGALYMGEPKPGDQYRILMIADGFGIHAKFLASARPDPNTGRLTIELNDLPQVPFEGVNLHLFASDRGLVATPTHCTIYNSDAEFVPWASNIPPQHSTSNFGLTSGPGGTACPGQIRPFSPTLVAGAPTALAGAYSSFTLRLDREDGDQFLGKLNFTMPPGLTANLRGITYCSDAAIASAASTLGRDELANPSCPASSEIGSSNVAAGPGSHPFHVTGKLYFAGPFQGAPFSLVAITPALAGPYDYGTVVVRVALHIDPLDAHVVADSETMPQIIGGIPIRMREIRVNIDKPNFMINPTNCERQSVESEGIGDQGTGVAFSSPFHAVNCSTLAFGPKMSITQLGGPKTSLRGHDPSLRFDLRTRPGDANIRSLAVTLPNVFEIDQNHLANLCSKSELEATRCAGRQPIGAVTDETPLLEKPLEGLAYAVAGFGGLPHVAFILGGQVMVIPQAESKAVGANRLRTTVPVVPDVPIGHFRFTLYGKSQGYLSNTRSLCARRPVVAISYQAQSGKARTQRVPVKTACGSKHHKPHQHLRL
jgi:hypothetical protein